MIDSTARLRLGLKATAKYNPRALAKSILANLERMESLSNAQPACARFRKSTGLTCAAEFRGRGSNGAVEDAITTWLAEFYPNAESQVPDLVGGVKPDICFGFKGEADGQRIVAVLEAKPVWQRWITTGEREYAGAVTDKFGRGTGNYANKNIQQLVMDRDKLLRAYVDPRDRHLLLALVFQRPGELDRRLVEAVGPGWKVLTHHVLDRCNQPDDTIGMTGMVFWRE